MRGRCRDRVKADLKRRQKALSELIIQQNRLAPDRYTGPDKKTLVKKASDRWLDYEPKAKILKVVMPIEHWKRSPKWTYSNGTWYFSDTSKIQAHVIVRHDDRLAVIRPVNLWIDHTAQERLTANSVFDLDHELQPSDYVLLEHVK